MAVSDIENIKKPVASLYPVVEGTRCVQVRIPDDDTYLPVLAGFVAILNQSWSWAGSLDERIERAQMWQNAYAETDWEGCVDCAEIQDCIENDEGVRGAITNIVNNNNNFPADSPYGQNLPDSRLTEDLSTAYNPECDYDILWAQCLGVVQATNNAITDVLQQVEVTTNVVELASSLLGSVPGVAGAEKAAGVDGVLSLINYYQEAIDQEYQSQYTTTPVTGTEDVIAFSLFCACKGTCVITIDKIVDIMQKDLMSIFPHLQSRGLSTCSNFWRALKSIARMWWT